MPDVSRGLMNGVDHPPGPSCEGLEHYYSIQRLIGVGLLLVATVATTSSVLSLAASIQYVLFKSFQDFFLLHTIVLGLSTIYYTVLTFELF